MPKEIQGKQGHLIASFMELTALVDMDTSTKDQEIIIKAWTVQLPWLEDTQFMVEMVYKKREAEVAQEELIWL